MNDSTCFFVRVIGKDSGYSFKNDIDESLDITN